MSGPEPMPNEARRALPGIGGAIYALMRELRRKPRQESNLWL
jgi:hypothetical protein